MSQATQLLASVLIFSLKRTFSARGFVRQLLLAGLVLGLVLGLDAKHSYPMSFFELASQIIPVLLLVLSLDLGIFRVPALGPLVKAAIDSGDPFTAASRELFDLLTDWTYRLCTLAALVLGEGLVLATVAYDHQPWRAGQGIALGAIFSGLLTIGYAAVVRQTDTDTK